MLSPLMACFGITVLIERHEKPGTKVVKGLML